MKKIAQAVKTVLEFLTVRNIAFIIIINFVFTAFRVTYDSSISAELNEAELLSRFLEVFSVMNVFGFSYIIAYLLLSKQLENRLNFANIALLGFTVFLFSVPFIYFIVPWNPDGALPIIQALLYTTSFVLFASWIFTLILYVLTRVSAPKFELLKEKYFHESKLREQKEIELHILQSQLEPHFFFNTLASLHGLIDSDQLRAKHLLEELTEYLRTTLPVFKQNFVTIKNEIGLVTRYLNIQKIRFADKLDFSIDVDPDVMELEILPMSILILVENAIKHGIEKTDGQGKIMIRCSVSTNNTIITEVIDTAGLYSKEASNTSQNIIIHSLKKSGVGLENLRSRLNLTYKNRAEFTIGLTEDFYTCAQLEVPTNG